MSAKKRCLLLSCAAATVFFILIVLFMPIQYETNDDSEILSHWAGYRTGTPTAYELGYSTIGLGFAVSRLYMWLPTLPWYTFVHFFMLWLSALVICFCIFDSGLNTKKALLISGISAVCFLSAIYLPASTVLQFTTTPAMAGGAAIVLLLHYRKGGGRYFLFTLFMLTLLMGFSYSMRPSAFYIGAALFVCIAIMQLLCCEGWRRQIAMLIAVPFVAVAVLYGFNATAYSAPEYKAFEEYNRARAQVVDYRMPSSEEAPEVYENAGLSQSEYDLILESYVLFDKVDTVMFQRLKESIAEYSEKHPELNERTMSGYAKQIFASTIHVFYFFLVLALSCIVFLIPVYCNIRKEDTTARKFIMRFILRHRFQITAVGILVFCILLNLYFTGIGRFPSRVYRAIVLVSAPPLFLLATRAVQNGVLSRARLLVIGSLALGAAVSSIAAVSFMGVLQERKAHAEPPYRYAYEYAVRHPESIYFSNISLSSVLNPAAVFPYEKPTNWMRSSGGGVYSPLYQRQLEINGLDQASQDVLLDSRAYYMTKDLTEAIITYYQEQFPEYEFVYIDEAGAGVKVYQLQSRKGGSYDPVQPS